MSILPGAAACIRGTHFICSPESVRGNSPSARPREPSPARHHRSCRDKHARAAVESCGKQPRYKAHHFLRIRSLVTDPRLTLSSLVTVTRHFLSADIPSRPVATAETHTCPLLRGPVACELSRFHGRLRTPPGAELVCPNCSPPAIALPSSRRETARRADPSRRSSVKPPDTPSRLSPPDNCRCF